MSFIHPPRDRFLCMLVFMKTVSVELSSLWGRQLVLIIDLIFTRCIFNKSKLKVGNVVMLISICLAIKAT